MENRVLWRVSCLNANLFSRPPVSLLVWTISSLPRFVKMKSHAVICCRCESYFSILQCVQCVLLTGEARCLYGLYQARKWTKSHTSLVLSYAITPLSRRHLTSKLLVFTTLLLYGDYVLLLALLLLRSEQWQVIGLKRESYITFIFKVITHFIHQLKQPNYQICVALWNWVEIDIFELLLLVQCCLHKLQQIRGLFLKNRPPVQEVSRLPRPSLGRRLTLNSSLFLPLTIIEWLHK